MWSRGVLMILLASRIVPRAFSTTCAAQLTRSTVAQSVLDTEYAVRGAVLKRALELEDVLRTPNHTLPFDKVIKCNIGNPHNLGQPPLTFVRQLLASSLYDLDVERGSRYPADVLLRSDEYLAEAKSLGAYSESQGLRVVRNQVAEFIDARDGVSPEETSTSPDNIFLINGASHGVRLLLTMLLRSPEDAVLVPVPQYPLYSALIALLKGSFVGYFFDESNDGWTVSLSEITRAYNDAVAEGKTPRALVIINPGNPTGASLSAQSQREIASFCLEKNLVLMADEVYQSNIYGSTEKFVSFKKTYRTLNSPPGLQLVSFHSISKGLFGECGLRGGYMEVVNLDEEVKAELYKLASIELCPNVPGQVVVGAMVKPPVKGEPSYTTYAAETSAIFTSLERRAARLQAMLNSLEGVTCAPLTGAMYAFPSITLPRRFVEHAQSENKVPDLAYALALLEETGIVVVPGSGFAQKPGTHHIRTTFLPSEQDMEIVASRFEAFHSKFMDVWR